MYIILLQEIKKAKENYKLFITHPPFVLTGPCPDTSVFMMKYWGIDIPKKRETPNIYMFLMELLFVNCMNEIPIAAEWKRM